MFERSFFAVRRHVAVAFVGSIFFSAFGTGCEPEKPAEHPVARMAPFDLDCPQDQLRYTQIDGGTWGVVGCGRRTKYVKLCREVGVGIFVRDECRWIQN